MPNQWWSSAGSAGTVDVADIGKVVFANSVVQLPGIDLVLHAELAAVSAVQTKAVIRYGVTPVEAILNGVEVGLKLCYRNGSGRAVAVLRQVEIASGNDTPTTRFDSQDFASSNLFQVNGPGVGTALDFQNYAYYVELTLTASSHPPMPVLFPPKVSVIQLLPGQIE